MCHVKVFDRPRVRGNIQEVHNSTQNMQLLIGTIRKPLTDIQTLQTEIIINDFIFFSRLLEMTNLTLREEKVEKKYSWSCSMYCNRNNGLSSGIYLAEASSSHAYAVCR